MTERGRQLLKEGRAKVFPLQREFLTEMLNGLREYAYYRIPVCDELPEGCEVVDVRDDWDSRSLSLLIVHESFPATEPGRQFDRIFPLVEVTLRRESFAESIV